MVGEVVRIIRQKVREGKISERRIDESYRRILKIKEKVREIGPRTPPPQPPGFYHLNVYTNPLSEHIYIVTRIERPASVQLKVYDMKGRFIFQQKYRRLRSGTHITDLKAYNITSGIYLIRIEIDGFSILKKVTLLKSGIN